MMGLQVDFTLIGTHFCGFYNKYMPDEVMTWRRAKIDFEKIRFKQVEVGRGVTKSTIQEMETARAKIDITGAKQEE